MIPSDDNQNAISLNPVHVYVLRRNIKRGHVPRADPFIWSATRGRYPGTCCWNFRTYANTFRCVLRVGFGGRNDVSGADSCVPAPLGGVGKTLIACGGAAPQTAAFLDIEFRFGIRNCQCVLCGFRV